MKGAAGQSTGMKARNMRLRCGWALALVLLGGCAGDTYAPVSDRTPRATGEARNGTYEVVRGDTLYSIAFRFGLDHRQLALWNGIASPYIIYPGQNLRLSAPSGRDRTASAPSRPQTSRPATSPSAQAGGSRQPQVHPPRARASSGSSPNNWSWPVNGEVVKAFSSDPDGKQGINIAGTEGQPIKAAAAGRVVYSGSGLVGYGNLVIIKHSGDYLTAYGYNRELLVSEGEDVRQGQTIARMGSSGGRPMLHFELRQDGSPVDPQRYLP